MLLIFALLTMFPYATHSYSVVVESYSKPTFKSEFVNRVDEIEVYHILYRLGVCNKDCIPERVHEARPLPPTKNSPMPVRYLEYPYYDFNKRIMVFITLKIDYV